MYFQGLLAKNLWQVVQKSTTPMHPLGLLIQSMALRTSFIGSISDGNIDELFSFSYLIKYNQMQLIKYCLVFNFRYLKVIEMDISDMFHTTKIAEFQ